jgi:low molecular weight protein-tyrosine phosphatase
MMPTRVLFVCLGNICRSPAAEAVFASLVAEAGVAGDFAVDSAGTGAWHVGEPADARMRRAARRRGIVISSIARQVTPTDFGAFDLIVAMDSSNHDVLTAMAPDEHRTKVVLFRDFDPDGRGEDVPDPYYGGAQGFDEVLDIVTRASRGLLAELTSARRA